MVTFSVLPTRCFLGCNSFSRLHKTQFSGSTTIVICSVGFLVNPIHCQSSAVCIKMQDRQVHTHIYLYIAISIFELILLRGSHDKKMILTVRLKTSRFEQNSEHFSSFGDDDDDSGNIFDNQRLSKSTKYTIHELPLSDRLAAIRGE